MSTLSTLLPPLLEDVGVPGFVRIGASSSDPTPVGTTRALAAAINAVENDIFGRHATSIDLMGNDIGMSALLELDSAGAGMVVLWPGDIDEIHELEILGSRGSIHLGNGVLPLAVRRDEELADILLDSVKVASGSGLTSLRMPPRSDVDRVAGSAS